MRLPIPDIPAPKPKDEDYMKVWHKCLQKDIENIRISRECCIWRTAFHIVVAILFAAVFALMVLCCSYFIYDNFYKST